MNRKSYSGLRVRKSGLFTREIGEAIAKALRSLRLLSVTGIGCTVATRNEGDGEMVTITVPQAEGQGSLYATITGDVISITPGTVNGVVPTISGDALDADPRPTLARTLWPSLPLLRVEWVPGNHGDADAGYVPDGIDSIVTATVVEGNAVTAMTEPEVDPVTGAATVNGVAYHALAKWTDDGAGNAVFSFRNSGHRQFAVCGATDFRFVWNGV